MGKGASLKTVGYPGFHAVTGSDHHAKIAESGSGLLFWSGSLELSASSEDQPEAKTHYL